MIDSEQAELHHLVVPNTLHAVMLPLHDLFTRRHGGVGYSWTRGKARQKRGESHRNRADYH